MPGPPFSTPNDKWSALTEREVQCVKLVSEGISNIEIAERIGATHGTVKKHLFNVFEKVGCDTRTQLAVWWLKDSGAAK